VHQNHPRPDGLPEWPPYGEDVTPEQAVAALTVAAQDDYKRFLDAMSPMSDADIADAASRWMTSFGFAYLVRRLTELDCEAAMLLVDELHGQFANGENPGSLLETWLHDMNIDVAYDGTMTSRTDPGGAT
jgi:hypothetical protein